MIPKDGEMGAGIENVLSIATSVTKHGKTIIEIIKSLYTWVTYKRPKLKIRLKTENFEFELDSDNLPEQQVVIDDVLALIKKSQKRDE